jgi:hypothetical protein
MRYVLVVNSGEEKEEVVSTVACLRCKQLIGPDEAMVVVATDVLSRWVSHAAERLDASRGRWHVQCVPAALREYVVTLDAPARPIEVHHEL